MSRRRMSMSMVLALVSMSVSIELLELEVQVQVREVVQGASSHVEPFHGMRGRVLEADNALMEAGGNLNQVRVSGPDAKGGGGGGHKSAMQDRGCAMPIPLPCESAWARG